MGYGLCGIIYSFIFMYFQNWRCDFYILMGLSLFGCIFICIFVYDSPRIYIENGEIEKMNNNKLPNNLSIEMAGELIRTPILQDKIKSSI